VTVSGEELSVNERLGDLEKRLPRDLFFRVNRSSLVNLSRVTAFRPKSHGDQQVFLTGGLDLTVSRTRRKAFLEALKSRGISTAS
jgi:DNA-binding LytR/AlgR family response regulator